MNATHDLSILTLIWNASAVVQFVMALLLVVSFLSWYYIFRKHFAIRAARIATEKFERDFWGGSDLNALYQSAVNHRHSTGSLERIFEAGFREYLKLKGQRAPDPGLIVDGARRAMHHEQHAVPPRHLAQIKAQRLQQLGACAFHEIEIVAVKHDAPRIGMLVVDAGMPQKRRRAGAGLRTRQTVRPNRCRRAWAQSGQDGGRPAALPRVRAACAANSLA